MSKLRMTAEARKQAIVKAALPLFAQRGFAETTTKDLARAAGVSEPLLYKHFPSKEALYLEIQEFGCRASEPAVRKLNEMEPSTLSLVRLVFYLMRALIVGKPSAIPEWDTRHRLMLNSLLHDGTFARLMYKNRFDWFCSRIEASIDVAIQSGDAIPLPIEKGNAARFAQHVGAWLALVHLPRNPAITYNGSREKLLDQAIWFVLRGMGLTDKAIATHYQPTALTSFFAQ